MNYNKQQKNQFLVNDSKSGKSELTFDRAKCLLYLQKAVHHLSNDELKNAAMEKVKNCLQELKGRKPFGFRDLSKDLEITKSPENVYAKEIIRDYRMFDGQVTKWLNDKIQLRSIGAVVGNMQVNLGKSEATITRSETRRLFHIFNQYYKELFDKILHGWDTQKNESQNLKDLKVLNELEALVDEIKSQSEGRSELAPTTTMDPNSDKVLLRWKAAEDFEDKILDVMAHVLCVWTFLDSSYFWICVSGDTNDEKSDSKMNDDKDIRYPYLRRPHAVQVAAMIRLLGLHELMSAQMGSQKKFVQIGTGEGKSLVIAASACVLGLFGWKVYCASYSVDLFNRDHNNYRNLFYELDIADKVFYGTFEQLCEKSISQDINVANSVRQLFYGRRYNGASASSGSNHNSNNSSREKRMLIIDEVDVFFDDNAIRKRLTKTTHIKNGHLSKICDLIWHHKKAIASWNDLKKVKGFNDLYNQCQNAFDEAFQPRVEREIKSMISGVQIFKSEETRKKLQIPRSIQ